MNMKKLVPLLFCLLSFGLASCSCPRGGAAPAGQGQSVSSAVAGTAPKMQQNAGGHNALNSLDYWGSYLPISVPEEKGIAQVEISASGLYSLFFANGEVVTGSFSWDSTGRRILLEGQSGQAYQFFVGENFIKLVSKGFEEGRIYRKKLN